MLSLPRALLCARRTFPATARFRFPRPASQTKTLIHFQPRGIFTSSQFSTTAQSLWSLDTKDDLHRIDKYLASAPWIALKPNTHWGFVVYRCTYKDNSQWRRMLNHLNADIYKTLELYERPDLLSSHRLTVMDDPGKYDGATSHDVREYFHSWVEGQLPTVLKEPGIWEPAVLGTEENGAAQRRLGTRYNFCLFVDDICLESLDKMEHPVVKLLCRFWGYIPPECRSYEVHPWWEDGETELDEEDVGWMYINAFEYCTFYRDLVDTDEWHENYLRPPQMLMMREDRLPGWWRVQKERNLSCSSSDALQGSNVKKEI